MAKYDRRILVPYLRDVCSAEMLCAKITREIGNCKTDINNLSNQVNQKIVDPARPYDSTRNMDSNFANHVAYIIIWLGIPLFVALLAFLCFGIESLGFVIVCIIVATIFGGPGIWDVLDDKRKDKAETQEALDRYHNQIEYNKRLRNQIPAKKQQLLSKQDYLCHLQNRMADAKKLRENLYGVNIIPARYRNIYAAYYLYDYFDSCREDDLDKIIQTMLLDEIKQRLDKVIVQNEQILLNQRIHLALQEQQNRTIAENHRQEMKRIASMERNQERQLDYQHMIARNQEVTNFFLAADYLRKN